MTDNGLRMTGFLMEDYEKAIWISTVALAI